MSASSIDNFELIKPLLTFDVNHFYWCQIIRRRKENPGLHKGSVLLRTYYFGSEDSWASKTNEIRSLCELMNARAYLNINKRSYYKVARLALKYLVDYLDDPKAARNVYDKACGNQRSEKRWIIDVDHHEPVATPVEPLLRVPTPNGYHLIVPPFDRRLLPGYDIHVDNPTVAYAPPH